MLSEKSKNLRTNISQQKIKRLNDYIIKIDFFDQKGTKNFQNNIPLKCILNPAIELRKPNISPNYF